MEYVCCLIPVVIQSLEILQPKNISKLTHQSFTLEFFEK